MTSTSIEGQENEEEREREIEHGDIFFFYRPKIEAETVRGVEDVQRFYMVTSRLQDDGEKYRLLLLGRKQLPEIPED